MADKYNLTAVDGRGVPIPAELLCAQSVEWDDDNVAGPLSETRGAADMVAERAEDA